MGRGDTKNGVTQQPRSVNISIANIFSKVNPSDENFLQYIPNGFLNQEQLKAKQNSVKNGRDSDYMLAVNSNDLVTAHRMVEEEAKQTAINQLHSAILNTVKGKTESFYWNKKEALYLLNDKGLQLPSIFQIQDGFVHSIHDEGSKVNTKLKNILEPC